MKKYLIKFLEPDTDVFLSADTRFYFAESETDALKQFAHELETDLMTESVAIVSEDPFILKVRGLAESDDHSRFESVEGEYQYIACEVIE